MATPSFSGSCQQDSQCVLWLNAASALHVCSTLETEPLSRNSEASFGIYDLIVSQSRHTLTFHAAAIRAVPACRVSDAVPAAPDHQPAAPAPYTVAAVGGGCVP